MRRSGWTWWRAAALTAALGAAVGCGKAPRKAVADAAPASVGKPESATGGEAAPDPFQTLVSAPLNAAERMRRLNDLKSIALAALQYHDTQQKLPGDVRADDGRGAPRLSWRTRLLPYLEQGGLAGRFNAAEPWDGPKNRGLVAEMPAIFRTPGAPEGHTSVFVVKGPSTAFDDPSQPARREHVSDGLSRTLFLVVARPEKAVPWTKPHDLEFDPANPAALLESIPEKNVLVGMFDGSVFVWRERPAAEVLRALVTISGGEPVEPPQ